jgi:hypothetical protein|tara:strand:- start:646 stop:975 length:330 start_codon:yes stop_codon:yes gene_type:complete
MNKLALRLDHDTTTALRLDHDTTASDLRTGEAPPRPPGSSSSSSEALPDHLAVPTGRRGKKRKAGDMALDDTSSYGELRKAARKQLTTARSEAHRKKCIVKNASMLVLL